MKDKIVDVVWQDLGSALPVHLVCLADLKGLSSFTYRPGKRYEILLSQNERSRSVVKGHIAVPIALRNAFQDIENRLREPPEVLGRHTDVYITIEDVHAALVAAINAYGLPVSGVVCENMGSFHVVSLTFEKTENAAVRR